MKNKGFVELTEAEATDVSGGFWWLFWLTSGLEGDARTEARVALMDGIDNFWAGSRQRMVDFTNWTADWMNRFIAE